MFKSVMAAKVASVLAWAACDNGDRLGTLVFSGKQHVETAPRSRKFGVLPFLHNLEQGCATVPEGMSQDHGLADALMRLRRVARPGSLVFIISDFVQTDMHSQSHLAALSQHCETRAIAIEDVLEQQLPPPGRYTVSDGKHFQTIDTRDKRLIAVHEQFCRARQTWLDDVILGQGIPLLTLRTDSDWLQALQQGLMRR